MKQFFCTMCIVFVLYPSSAQDIGVKGDFVSIKNGNISAKIKFMGAELVSLKDDSQGIEYIWQGDADNWANSSPILFPIVGSLKDGEYFYDGEVYKMPQHGFAKDMRFELAQQSGHKVTFSLKANESTLCKYPFKFELQVTYQLKEKELSVTYQVINQDDKTMFFSIGGHPGFNISAREGGTVPKQYLVFNKRETARIFSRKEKFLDGKEIVYLDNQKKIYINEDLCKDGARIFFGLKSNQISIHNGKKKVLTLLFDGFPFLAIWSRPSNPGFICLEPWHGIPDFVSTNQSIEEKIGIIQLEPDKEFKCLYTLEI